MTSVSTPPCSLGSSPAAIPTELLDRLSAATAGSRELDAAIYNAAIDDGGRFAFRCQNWGELPGSRLGRYHDGWLVGTSENDAYAGDLPRFTYSIDAAIRLSEQAHRGGWLNFQVLEGRTDAKQCFEGGRAYWATHQCPALALCVAILKALAATPSAFTGRHEGRQPEVTPSNEPIHE